MSYCRWSSEDFQCDLYVYEDVAGGWTTHVAGNKVIFTEPLPEPVELVDNANGWHERYVKVMAMIDDAERVPLDLPHDGETFNDPTALACAERLEGLRELGYRVPQYAIDELRAEANG